ncbi:Nucleotidyltransferase domain protein [Mycobacteroides salmoniphilum]|uniref:Nucleotidyltransferase domain protein n=1 Tax=Mycobacteroides salmoniphilum TaxID=404941 RepID=A0A4R8S1Y5_9MYCO|nr:nucleotidyltransferase domain-containing protein [Mycobacteroides salmoniphilum]TDZ75614.1 Nucleotidyltransferase domain protein [Mycobacteroides salmoniphilum]TDZ83191.1 Nucleotidyltransferase domain protein [Mycobacteroides salmoniphilum]TDZ84133.1 Nucleotidyltransferase domain protein [Mycobacteroides salmoniphilum]
MTDTAFLDSVADSLSALPAVEAVTLGGSRAQGTHRPDSDWDLAIYYRGHFDPDNLRQIGWDGEVSEIGAWGGGVFNGGAWLHIDGRDVDVHYRDLADVHKQLVRAQRGEFHIEPLMFHLAGIPSYLVVGELALNKVLHGILPCPDYPAALRESAPEVWAARAALNVRYAEKNHAPHGRVTQCAGLLAVAAMEYAHAARAARGAWVTNEKHLLDAAGLSAVHTILADLSPDPAALTRAAEEIRSLGESVG